MNTGDAASPYRDFGFMRERNAMTSLTLIYWLAGAGALGLFVYLGYALLRPEQF